MIDLQIKLAFVPTLMAPNAIFVRGSSPEDWLRHIDGILRGQKELKLIPVTDLSGQLRGGFFFGFSEQLPAAAAAYGQLFHSVHPRMWLPCNANTTPKLNHEDWDSLLGAENIHVWFSPDNHLAYESSQIFLLSHLVTAQVDHDKLFDRSVPGVRFFDRLQSLSVPQPPQLDEFFQTARDNIGDNADRLDELPPSQDEQDPKRPMLPGLNRLVGKTITTLTGLLPGGAAHRTWINDLEDWARNLNPTQPAVDQQKRNTEIQRLLKMLADDPDQGLKFAIPMGNSGGRGMASSGNQLTQRNTNYQWGGQGGGVGSDPWQIEQEQRFQLMQQYREAAQRELDLGRHRRAAYIFADLLQDYLAAANALCRGRHFREAAQIYREKLNNRLEAANCLRQGGYLSEAAIELEGLHRWEEAGDLYAVLEQSEKAEICYRQRIDELKQSHQTVSAAKILFEKLRNPEEACTLLLNEWENASDMVPRIKEFFRINQACCDAAANRDWLQNVEAETINPRQRSSFFAFLVNLTTEDPDSQLRSTAQSLTPVFAARWMSDGDMITKQEILRQFGKYRPADKLLSRDCRFILQQLAARQPRITSTPIKTSQSMKLATIVQRLTLPQSESTRWIRFVAFRSVIYAAASHDQHIMLGRVYFGSSSAYPPQIFELKHLPAASIEDAFFDVHSGDVGDSSPHFLLLGFGNHSPLAVAPKIIFEPWDHDLPQNRTAIRSPISSLMDQTTLGYGICNRDRHLLLRVTENEFVISQFRNDLSLEQSTSVPEDILASLQWNEAVNPLPMVCRNGITAIAIGRTLLLISKDGLTKTQTFPAPIVDVKASPQGTRLRFAISFRDGGGAMLWHGENSEPFLFEMEHGPMVMEFTRTGMLITVGDQGNIYVVGTEHLTRVGRFEVSDNGVSQVLPGTKPNTFFMCYRSGLVEEMEVR